MLVAAGILLLVNALFNAAVWPRFWTRIKNDPRAHDEQRRATAFLKVHAVLIGSALLLAVASAVGGILALLSA